MTPTSIAGYMALFVLLTSGFLFVHLMIGRLLRPNLPNLEKQQIYECGEPTIGSSFVQFDLRFYVVALLFIIFDVEIAFFFPWATVFGKATQLMDPRVQKVEVVAGSDPADPKYQLSPDARNRYAELGVPDAAMPPLLGKSPLDNKAYIEDQARRLALMSVGDILIFFAIVLIGYAYVWSRGDLNWVRAVSEERARRGAASQPQAPRREQEPVLV